MAFKLKFEGRHLISILVGLGIIFISLFLFNGNFMQGSFVFVGMIVVVLQFLIDFFVEVRRQKEIEDAFPDYVRNLVGAVKSGMPISKAIVYVSKTEYGPLTYYAKKMSNQIEWNIPVRRVMTNFANEIGNPIIRRSISTVLEAEKSGGNIEDVLGSITDSLITIKRLKDERKSSIQGQITQSYVIFFIFLAVLIVIQNVLIPYMSQMDANESAGFSGGSAIAELQAGAAADYSSPAAAFKTIISWFKSLSGIFMMLALFQSFFAGIILGKMSEGDYRAGLRHSFIMMGAAIFILVAANSMLAAILQETLMGG